MLDDAKHRIQRLQQRSDAFHAGVIGALNDAEGLIHATLKAVRGLIERPTNRFHDAVGQSTRAIESWRPR